MEASPGSGEVVISLDNGAAPGIRIHNQGNVPEEIRDHFFEKYTTAQKARGTGLGTYSAKLIVQAMGGTIAMETARESGTTINISFPPQPPEADGSREDSEGIGPA